MFTGRFLWHSGEKNRNVFTQKKKKWCRTTMISKISLFLNFIIFYNEAVNYRHRSQILCSAAGCLIRENWHSRSCHSICGPTYYTTLQKIVQPTWQRDQITLLICLTSWFSTKHSNRTYIRTGDILLTNTAARSGNHGCHETQRAPL